jgi:hypothetical protein
LIAVDEILLRPDRAHLQDTLARDRGGSKARPALAAQVCVKKAPEPAS